MVRLPATLVRLDERGWDKVYGFVHIVAIAGWYGLKPGPACFDENVFTRYAAADIVFYAASAKCLDGSPCISIQRELDDVNRMVWKAVENLKRLDDVIECLRSRSEPCDKKYGRIAAAYMGLTMLSMTITAAKMMCDVGPETKEARGIGLKQLEEVPEEVLYAAGFLASLLARVDGRPCRDVVVEVIRAAGSMRKDDNRLAAEMLARLAGVKDEKWP